MLDPTLIERLHALTSDYKATTAKLDQAKWSIAFEVNDMWPEHSTFFAGNKKDYYIECTRIANEGLTVNVFGESGQTLRRWCEVQAACANIPHIEGFLERLSFDHLSKAKKLVRDEKVSAIDYALATALNNGWSADDMVEHFAPTESVHVYDRVSGALELLTGHDAWDFLKDTTAKESCIMYAKMIRNIVAAELEKEGKAV